MEKVSKEAEQKSLWDVQTARNTEKINEKTRQDKNPKITRYELSKDKAGLIAHLAGGNSYHIHSNELTPEQRLIKIELLGMEGGK